MGISSNEQGVFSWYPVGSFPFGQKLVDKLVDKTAPVGLVDRLVDNKYNKKWQKIREKYYNILKSGTWEAPALPLSYTR